MRVETDLNFSCVHAGKITPGMNTLPIGMKDTREYGGMGMGIKEMLMPPETPLSQIGQTEVVEFAC